MTLQQHLLFPPPSLIGRRRSVAAGALRRHIVIMSIDETFSADETLSGHEAQARSVRRGFWEKVRKTLGVVPFLEEAVAAFYCAIDPLTPSWVKATLFGALAYFILPFDAVPDFLAGLGYTDDLAVLAGAVRAVGGHVSDEHRARARATLDRFRADRP
jgi:uncharacterized membrane protein YkvA (DUF1232 family)